MKRAKLLVAVIALLITPCLAAKYQFTTVDFPGAVRTRVFAINDFRRYVGAYWDASGDIHAIFFDGHGLSPLDLSSLGTVHRSRAFSLNNHGYIVGQYADESGNTHGYVFHNGVATPIDYPGATFTAAYGINDWNTIIGIFFDAQGNEHAYKLRHGKFTLIDVGTGETFPLSINDRGEVVGEFIDVPDTTGHGYFQTPGGKSVLYDVPGAPANSTFFISINNFDEILGEYFPTDSFQNFILDDGQLVLFNLGGGLMPTFVSAQTINDFRDVVGWFDDAAGEHGFLALRRHDH